MLRGDHSSRFFAQMDDQVLEANVLGGFEGALDFVHGVDAAGFFRMEDVDAGRAGAAHFPVRIKRGVHGEGLERIGLEPFAQFQHVLAAGVVEVLAGSENLYRLRAGTLGKLQQPRMQAMVEKKVGGENSQHIKILPCKGRK